MLGRRSKVVARRIEVVTSLLKGEMHTSPPRLDPDPIAWERKERAERARALIGPRFKVGDSGASLSASPENMREPTFPFAMSILML